MTIQFQTELVVGTLKSPNLQTINHKAKKCIISLGS